MLRNILEAENSCGVRRAAITAISAAAEVSDSDSLSRRGGGIHTDSSTGSSTAAAHAERTLLSWIRTVLVFAAVYGWVACTYGAGGPCCVLLGCVHILKVQIATPTDKAAAAAAAALRSMQPKAASQTKHSCSFFLSATTPSYPRPARLR